MRFVASPFRVTSLNGSGCAALEPDAHVGPRSLSDWELLLVLSGRARWEGGGTETVELHPGDLLIAPPGPRESLFVGGTEPLHHAFLHLLIEGPTCRLPRRTANADAGIIAPLLQHAIHLLATRPPADHAQACDAIELLLMATANGCVDAPGDPIRPLHPLVHRALSHLRQRWLHRLTPVSCAEMAKAAGSSREHLFRCFKSAFGVSPHQAERLLRLDRAVDWLIGSDLPISVIAQRAGWSDQTRFARALRAASGRGPRALRRAWKEGQGVRQVALARLGPLRAALA